MRCASDGLSPGTRTVARVVDELCGRLHPVPVRFRSAIRIAIVLAAGCAAALPAMRADTIFLKDGTQILDCKVTKETDTLVYLKSPVGDMVVPKTEILRIQKTKSNYDRYTEQLAEIREGDAGGLFKLALWCRKTDGLRKEADELLTKVLSLKEDHAEARYLLGHVRLGREWVAPPPLVIRLKADGQNAGDIRKNLENFLGARKDMRLATEAETKAKADPGSPLDGCTMEASVIISRKAPMKFYGVTFGGPSYGATVRMQTSVPWVGRAPLKTAIEGQVPGNGGSGSLAVQNAFGTGSMFLHRFLDQLTELRRKALEEDFRKKEREKKAAPKVKAASGNSPSSVP